MTAKVVALHGESSATGEREPNPVCIELLERWLEMAKSGEMIGVVVSGRSFDGCARYGFGGNIGGYSLLGAMEMARADVVAFMRDEE